MFSKIGKGAVSNVLNGYNSTVFAYGQTGSGKTFTVTGGAERCVFSAGGVCFFYELEGGLKPKRGMERMEGIKGMIYPPPPLLSLLPTPNIGVFSFRNRTRILHRSTGTNVVPKAPEVYSSYLQLPRKIYHISSRGQQT